MEKAAIEDTIVYWSYSSSLYMTPYAAYYSTYKALHEHPRASELNLSGIQKKYAPKEHSVHIAAREQLQEPQLLHLKQLHALAAAPQAAGGASGAAPEAAAFA